MIGDPGRCAAQDTLITVTINARLAWKANPVYKLFRPTRCRDPRINLSGDCPKQSDCCFRFVVTDRDNVLYGANSYAS
jgi:hypothetical protein